MTPNELKHLLNRFAAVYNWRPTDAKAVFEQWYMAFSEYDAADVYMAARVVMESSRYLPKIADVKKAINKGRMLYGPQSTNAITAPEAPKRDIRDGLCLGSSICPYFDSICHGTPEEVELCNI